VLSSPEAAGVLPEFDPLLHAVKEPMATAIKEQLKNSFM
jgi:hypothetical protein